MHLSGTRTYFIPGTYKTQVARTSLNLMTTWKVARGASQDFPQSRCFLVLCGTLFRRPPPTEVAVSPQRPTRYPNGHVCSSTRKVPSVGHVMNSMKNLEKMGFKSNDGNVFPGWIPRRFFKVRLWNVANVSYKPLGRPDLTYIYIFLLDFWWVIWLFAKSGPP